MSAIAEQMDGPVATDSGKRRAYTVIVLMATTALIISAAVIVYFDQITQEAISYRVYDRLELLAGTMMPYMISAAIAAITAIGILTILPTARMHDPARILLNRLHSLKQGDLSSAVTLAPNHQLRDIAGELNDAVATLGNNLSQMKVINRQQWDVLGRIKAAASVGNSAEVMSHVGEMERNWAKIAEIEHRLMT